MGRKPKTETAKEEQKCTVSEIDVMTLLPTETARRKYINLANKLGVGYCQLATMLMQAAADGKIKFKKISKYEIEG